MSMENRIISLEQFSAITTELLQNLAEANRRAEESAKRREAAMRELDLSVQDLQESARRREAAMRELDASVQHLEASERRREAAMWDLDFVGSAPGSLRATAGSGHEGIGIRSTVFR